MVRARPKSGRPTLKIALIDNGSVEPAAHESLRLAAARISGLSGLPVEAVSWKHSDRIAAERLSAGKAWTLSRWLRARVGEGERSFLFIPFFISPQGAIGSALRGEIEATAAELGGFDFAFTAGLPDGSAIEEVVCDRIRVAATGAGLRSPSVAVVDHGGPSPASAAIRDRVAGAVQRVLGTRVATVRACSMESPDGPQYGFNRPLLGELLRQPGFNSGDVIIAPLFLSPGRHAGPGGDLAQIAREAEQSSAGLRCHFAELVGSHPLSTDFLAQALLRATKQDTTP